MLCLSASQNGICAARDVSVWILLLHELRKMFLACSSSLENGDSEGTRSLVRGGSDPGGVPQAGLGNAGLSVRPPPALSCWERAVGSVAVGCGSFQ